MILPGVTEGLRYSVAITFVALGVFGYVKSRFVGISPWRGALADLSDRRDRRDRGVHLGSLNRIASIDAGSAGWRHGRASAHAKPQHFPLVGSTISNRDPRNPSVRPSRHVARNAIEQRHRRRRVSLLPNPLPAIPAALRHAAAKNQAAIALAHDIGGHAEPPSCASPTISSTKSSIVTTPATSPCSSTTTMAMP